MEKEREGGGCNFEKERELQIREKDRKKENRGGLYERERKI